MSERGVRLNRAFLFLLIPLAAELFLLATLAFTQRMPNCHDGFQYFVLQYHFLSGATQTGELPQWIPYLTHGLTSTWWYVVQASLSQQIWMALAFLFKGANLLFPFYAGLFLDTFILVLGTWALAGRFFKVPSTRLLISATAAWTFLWVSQPWFNFHIVCYLPLVLYWIHDGIERGRWNSFFLAGSLLAFQFLGNLSYYLPVHTLFIFLYFSFFALLNPEPFWKGIRSLRWRRPDFLGLLWMVLSWAFLARLLMGLREGVCYVDERGPNGVVPLEVFLRYGDNFRPAKWLEMFLGFSPGLDYSLYLGMAGAGLLLWGALSVKKRHLHFLLLALFMLAFSQATFVSQAAYHVWPFMKLFRHLGLSTAYIKLCFCFLLGVGFEALSGRLQSRFPRRMALWVCALPLLAGAATLWVLSREPELMSTLLRSLFQGYRWETFEPVVNPEFLAFQLSLSAALAGAAGLLFAVIAVTPRPARLRTALVLLLALQLFDLFIYRATDAALKTVPLLGPQQSLVRQQPLTYIPQRLLLSAQASAGNRFSVFKEMPLQGSLPAVGPLFAHLDEPLTAFPVVFAQKPFDRFLRMYKGAGSFDDPHRNPYWPLSWRYAPLLVRPATLKATGMAEPKVQFFSRGWITEDEEQVARWITRPDYKGDMLLLYAPDRESCDAALRLETAQLGPETQVRLQLPAQVREFDSNGISIFVQAPPEKPVWLYYADVWDPGWKATVDGLPVPIFRANLAYKAVPVPPGEHLVRFRFQRRDLLWGHRFFTLSAFLWLILIARLATKLAREGSARDETAQL